MRGEDDDDDDQNEPRRNAKTNISNERDDPSTDKSKDASWAMNLKRLETRDPRGRLDALLRA